ATDLGFGREDIIAGAVQQTDAVGIGVSEQDAHDTAADETDSSSASVNGGWGEFSQGAAFALCRYEGQCFADEFGQELLAINYLFPFEKLEHPRWPEGQSQTAGER